MTASEETALQELGEQDLNPTVVVSERVLKENAETGFSSNSPGDKSDASPHSISKKEGGTMAVDADVATPGKAMSSEPASPTLSETHARVQRSSSRIASLRAAFERKPSNGPQDSERMKQRSPSGRSFWEQENEGGKARDAEILKLKDTLEKEVELRKAIEEKCAALEDQNRKLQERLGGWQGEMARQNAILMAERDNARQAFVDIQNKLLGLKRSISTSTRVDNQVADATFVQEMRNAFHDVQNWVVNNFRRVKIETFGEQLCERLEGVAGPKQLDYLKPIFRDFDATTSSALKLPAFQAAIASYLIDIFDDPTLFGLPISQDWCRSVRKASDSLSAVLPHPAYNKWRSTTLDVIKQGIDIKESLESASRSLSEVICTTLSALTELDSASMVFSLNAIVKRIVSLSHVFRVQRAQYEFCLPLPGSPFDSATMDGDETSPEPIMQQDSVLRFALFPSVIKRGDELGDSPQVVNVVVKARVLCYS